tara:strand:+ start:3328 stop:3558 length:231 start_codon:yes stop_codon:yes gene_type:complete
MKTLGILFYVLFALFVGIVMGCIFYLFYAYIKHNVLGFKVKEFRIDHGRVSGADLAIPFFLLLGIYISCFHIFGIE